MIFYTVIQSENWTDFARSLEDVSEVRWWNGDRPSEIRAELCAKKFVIVNTNAQLTYCHYRKLKFYRVGTLCTNDEFITRCAHEYPIKPE